MNTSDSIDSPPPKATSFPEVVIAFGPYVAGKTFDSLVCEALEKHKNTDRQPRICVLDFRETEWIDLVSTQSITSFSIAARKRNWLPVIRPPANKAARDFWRLWQFPEAFEDATKVSFSRLISGDDRKFLSERQTTYSERSLLQIHDPLNVDAKRSLNFFGFVSDAISGSNLAHVASKQADKWTISDVQNILAKHIGGRCDYIPTRVVFEAVFNATKHPGATIVQSASYHDKFAKQTSGENRQRDSDFVVLFWDNGRSMVSTINSALDSGVDLEQHYIHDLQKEYDVTFKIHGRETSYRKVVSSEIDINSDLSSELRLLSTVFPGVSSKPELEGTHEVHPEVSRSDERFARRGMGLFVLVNAAVDVLGGSVSFRTGKFYMHISKHKPREAKKIGAPFRVQIVEMPDILPEFEGNMISIRIPTEKARDEVVGHPNSIQ